MFDFVCRYTVENVPLYDSAEDETFSKPASTTAPVKYESLVTDSAAAEKNLVSDIKLEQNVTGISVVTDMDKEMESLEESKPVFSPTNAMISRIRSNSACRNYNIGPSPSSKKRPQHTANQKSKTSSKKYVSSKPIAELFASKKAQEEIRRYEVHALIMLLTFNFFTMSSYDLSIISARIQSNSKL